MRIHKGNEWKAAFTTHKGSFKPLIMYFGLCNSPATFQKMMNKIFHDMSDVCIVYIDDLMIFTEKDNQEEHDRVPDEPATAIISSCALLSTGELE